MLQHLVRLLNFWHHQIWLVKDFLVPEIEKRQRGRPAVNSTSINLRLPPDLLGWLDAERAKLEQQPSRPEMIRLFLEERRGRVVVRG